MFSLWYPLDLAVPQIPEIEIDLGGTFELFWSNWLGLGTGTLAVEEFWICLGLGPGKFIDIDLGGILEGFWDLEEENKEEKAGGGLEEGFWFLIAP